MRAGTIDTKRVRLYDYVDVLLGRGQDKDRRMEAAVRREAETSVVILAEPGKQVTWQDFLEQYAAPAISLDGHCRAPTLFSPDKRHINLNHHGRREHDGIAVLATCAQALRLVRDAHLFLSPIYLRGGRPCCKVWINDCDQDVCLATFILRNPSLVNRPKLHQLVSIEERLDTTAGLLVLDNDETEMLGEVAWIFDPYAQARISGDLVHASPEDMLRIIDEVHGRIRCSLFGRQQRIRPDRRFEDLVLPRPEAFAVVRELGVFARLKMAEEGILAYAVLKAEHDGTYHWSLGKASPFIPMDLGTVYDVCNRIEGIAEGDSDRWGGSRNRGGSPRIRGSKLSPDELAAIIDEAICR